MIFDWYKIFNETEFLATGLSSRTITPLLDTRGQVEFLITRGNETSVLYLDTFLPVNFLNRNPYIQNGYAVYRDENNDVWFGFEV